MTTIACTPNVMASDSHASDENGICNVVKMWRVPQGILGSAGVFAVGYAVSRWMMEHQRGDPPKMDGATLLLITGTQILCYDESPDPYPVDDPFAAIGSGSMAAIACLHMGATPSDAVKIASKIDPYTGGKIRTLEV